MLKSMTGFGRGEYSDDNYTIVVEIRSINHKYSDFFVRIPRKYSFAEEYIRTSLKEVIKRGKVEVNITVDSTSQGDVDIELNMELAEKYCKSLYSIQDSLGIAGDIDINSFCKLPEILKIVQGKEEEDLFTAAVKNAMSGAIEKLDNMRIIEGEHMVRDIRERAILMKDIVDKIEKYAPKVSEKYVCKMKERIVELVGENTEIPEDRILLEAAIFADKSNVTEEIIRLKSHIDKLLGILEVSDGPEGKKMDFLMQEMNREANTVGSKANDLEITENVLILKSEIEKIREQVQNIE